MSERCLPRHGTGCVEASSSASLQIKHTLVGDWLLGLERKVSFLLYKLAGQPKPARVRSRGRRVPVFGRRHSK